MKRRLSSLFFAGLSVWACLSSALSSPGAPPAKVAILYVATRHDTVRDLLWMADVGTNDVVYDLGSPRTLGDRSAGRPDFTTCATCAPRRRQLA